MATRRPNNGHQASIINHAVSMMMTTMLLLMRGGDVNDVDGDSDGNYKLSME